MQDTGCSGVAGGVARGRVLLPLEHGLLCLRPITMSAAGSWVSVSGGEDASCTRPSISRMKVTYCQTKGTVAALP